MTVDAQKTLTEHQRVAKAFGDTLVLGTPSAWLGLVPVLCARMTPSERQALAFASLWSLNPADAQDAVQAAQKDARGCGWPIAPLISFMDDAAFWADMAEPDEIKAYCLACYDRMAQQDQAAFLNHVVPEAAA